MKTAEKLENPVGKARESVNVRVSVAAELLGLSDEEQHRSGFFHTLREILQQPSTWRETADLMQENLPLLRQEVSDVKAIMLTGSGSSEYAGESVRLVLQDLLGIPAETVGGGKILTEGSKALLPLRPALMISLARSGDSPESTEVVSTVLETEPEIRHLVITCNAQGSLVTHYKNDPRVLDVVLAERTNDRSLVMTSSFTNMVLAVTGLGFVADRGRYVKVVEVLSNTAELILSRHFDDLATIGRRDFNRAIYLATGPRIGAAREAALKMTEMTAGRVLASSETYLGLRHGPMSAVHAETLIVCFLSSEPVALAYECDLIRELNEKQLGMAKVFFGAEVPEELVRTGDVVIECPGLAELGDAYTPVLDTLCGQVLAFFRCMKEGLQPDAPSVDGVISRVVREFRLHRREL